MKVITEVLQLTQSCTISIVKGNYRVTTAAETPYKRIIATGPVPKGLGTDLVLFWQKIQ